MPSGSDKIQAVLNLQQTWWSVCLSSSLFFSLCLSLNSLFSLALFVSACCFKLLFITKRLTEHNPHSQLEHIHVSFTLGASQQQFSVVGVLITHPLHHHLLFTTFPYQSFILCSITSKHTNNNISGPTTETKQLRLKYKREKWKLWGGEVFQV